MQRQIQLNISLTPVRHYDETTDQHVTYYEEFPQAVAVGDTEEQADNKLIHLVERMWQDEKQDLIETLKGKYLQDKHLRKPGINLNLA